MQGRLLGPVVRGHDRHVEVGGRGLGIGHVDGPVAPLVEDAGVHELELEIPETAARVLLDETLVGELRLRVVVAPLEQGVARQPLQIPPVLLGVLAVVALGPREPEHALLEDRVAPVPQGETEAQLVANVGDPRHAVLVPAECPRPGVVVRERRPRVTVPAVVLAHRAPGPLGEVGAPLVPRVRCEQVVVGPARGLGQTAVFGGVVASHETSPPMPRGAWHERTRPPSPRGDVRRSVTGMRWAGLHDVDVDDLDGVVAVAEAVPGRDVGLHVAGGVGRPRAQRVPSHVGGLPGEGPVLPLVGPARGSRCAGCQSPSPVRLTSTPVTGPVPDQALPRTV